MSQFNHPPLSWILQTMDKENFKLTSDQVEKLLQAQSDGATLVRIGGVVVNARSISSLYHIKECALINRIDTIRTMHPMAREKYQKLLSMKPEERITYFDQQESQGLLKPGGSGQSEDLLPNNDKLRLPRPSTTKLGETTSKGN